MRQLLAPLLVAVLAALFCHVTALQSGLVDSDNGANKTHNFYFGRRSGYDRVLYHDVIKHKSKWMSVVSLDKQYPAKGQYPQGNITYIEVLDQRTDGTGGYVQISKGGVGSNFVTLHFKTQRNHGMDFVVFVFGY